MCLCRGALSQFVVIQRRTILRRRESRNIHQDSWFEAALVRSSVVQKLPGGISAVVAAIVNVFFEQGRHDMSTAGVHLKLHDGSSLHIVVSLEIVIADELALHCFYMCKGSSGLKPCMLCANVFNRNNTREVLQHDRTGVAIDHCCSDSSKIVLHTSDTIRALIRRLAAAEPAMGKVAFEKLQVHWFCNHVCWLCAIR